MTTCNVELTRLGVDTLRSISGTCNEVHTEAPVGSRCDLWDADIYGISFAGDVAGNLYG